MVSQGKAIGWLLVSLVCVLGLGDGATYGAATFGFTSTSATTVTDARIGETQFFMDVLDESARLVLFRFRNEGPTASSISGVLFEDRGGVFAPVFASVQPRNVPGVVFTRPLVTPALVFSELFEPFTVTPELTLTATVPALTNGINPGESLDVLATLTDDIVTAEMMRRLEVGTVRVALQSIGFPDGGVALFVNNRTPVVTPTPPTPTPPGPGVIPAPGAILLGAMGAGLVGWLRRRRTLA